MTVRRIVEDRRNAELGFQPVTFNLHLRFLRETRECEVLYVACAEPAVHLAQDIAQVRILKREADDDASG